MESAAYGTLHPLHTCAAVRLIDHTCDLASFVGRVVTATTDSALASDMHESAAYYP